MWLPCSLSSAAGFPRQAYATTCNATDLQVKNWLRAPSELKASTAPDLLPFAMNCSLIQVYPLIATMSLVLPQTNFLPMSVELPSFETSRFHGPSAPVNHEAGCYDSSKQDPANGCGSNDRSARLLPCDGSTAAHHNVKATGDITIISLMTALLVAAGFLGQYGTTTSSMVGLALPFYHAAPTAK